MPQHIITRQIGNLRGFSTESIFFRPSNVADIAINIQKAPDGTEQLRRGYQCQIAAIGGMGIGTFDDSASDDINTVCVDFDGFLYTKVTKQIFFYYDGQVTGQITGASQSNPCIIHDVNHGLQTGAEIIIRDVGGMEQLNNNTYTITYVDPDNFSLDGVDSSLFTAYTSGGYWSIAFADNRYLTFTIFTDPRYLVTNPGWSVGAWSFTPWGAPSGESITCNVTVNRAAQVNGNQLNVNTVNVEFGHELVATDVIQFYASNGAFNQRTVISTTPTSITFDGYPASFLDGVYISQFFDIPFRKGFDTTSPFLISNFISILTDPVTGVYGLQIAINGDSNLPAAFLQIIEPFIIDNSQTFSLDYWYWEQVNSTINPPMPGSANPLYQNSPNFEVASFAAYDDVIYVANGWDFPQKFDGQTVYRAGMPQGLRPNATDNTVTAIKPFSSGDVYQYLITYEQIDDRDHIVEGEASETWTHIVGTTFSAINVIVNNLQSTINNNWNTNGAIAVGGVATVYGPDAIGAYYNQVSLNAGFTLKIGDSAYFLNASGAQFDGNQNGVVNIKVLVGHGIQKGDTVYFNDSVPKRIRRTVTKVTPTFITIQGTPVNVLTGKFMYVYIVSKVFGNVAIVNGNQNDVNTIIVQVGHTIQNGDIVEFIDEEENVQRRTVTATAANSVTIDSVPVNILDGFLIAAISLPASYVNLQTFNPNPITLIAGKPLSNNLRINIYRTDQGVDFIKSGKIYLVASIPNDSSGPGTQTYIDHLVDVELGIEYSNPDEAPNPPPISKYVRSFGNQLFYGGGSRSSPIDSDRVFFSEGANPEYTPLSSFSIVVPNVDDEVTGIGVSGTTLVITKNHSLWAVTGNFLTGQIDVVQIAPGSNIGCIAHASIASIGTLMYFLHTNGVYAITENQLYPTDAFGNPIPISIAIDALFRTTPYLPQTRYVFKRAVACNYTKDNQYLLFLPCEDANSSIRTANSFSQILCYDYQEKNWYQWFNMNAASGIFVIDDDLYFQERRFSSVNGNTANLYKQHRFYRLVDHADHAGPQICEWRSSWEDLGQPEVRKKFCRCILLMDRLSELYQYNNPQMMFSSYLNRIPNLQNTIANITQTDNIRNSTWSYSAWGWNYWSGYQDSFVTVNLKQGTVAKSIQVGFKVQGINMDIRLAGFQLEAIPENRRTVVR